MAGGDWIGTWSPGIGDPTWLGWITVGAYALAATGAFVVAGRGAERSARSDRSARPERSERGSWRLLALVLVALGVNKQLDLQTAFTELGRMLARELALYEQRRALQVAFIFTLTAVTLVVLVLLYRRLRRASAALRTALLGLTLLALFVLIRASSFHAVDQLLFDDGLGARPNWILELGGLAVIGGAAWFEALRGRKRVS